MHDLVQFGLLVIFGFVMLPVYAMFVGWLFGKPRDFKPVGIAFMYLFVYISVTIIGLGIVGSAISLVA